MCDTIQSNLQKQKEKIIVKNDLKGNNVRQCIITKILDHKKVEIKNDRNKVEIADTKDLREPPLLQSDIKQDEAININDDDAGAGPSSRN